MRKPTVALTLATCLVLIIWPALGAPETAPDRQKTAPAASTRILPSDTASGPRAPDNGCPLRASPTEAGSDNAIPFFDLIADAVAEYSVRVTIADTDPRTALTDALKGVDEQTRTLATLYTLWDGLGRDGLHSFFFMRAGGLAPQARSALKEAGLNKDYDTFGAAMALFGEDYPFDEKAREKFFGYAHGQGEYNDFDRRLLDLANQFPSRTEFAQEIEGYVTRHDELWHRIEARRKAIGAQRRFGILIDNLWRKIPSGSDDEDVPQRLAKLSFPEQTLIALDAFSSEFENGGIHQFFFNSTGAFAPEVLAGLRALNLTQQAQLFERAMKTFPSPYPRDRDKRAASYLGHRDLEGFESELAELTDEFYAADTAQPNSKPHSATNATGLRSAILRYAEAHKLLPC